MSSQRIYLVGAGVIGRYHADAVDSLTSETNIELFVADLDPAARAQFREMHPEAAVFENSERMLDDEPKDNDIVVVATPPFAHHELAITAIESGRNVLCEKPLATTTGEAAEMVALAKDRGVLFGSCSCRFLGYAPTDQVVSLVSSGRLGDIYNVTWIKRQRRNRTGIELQPESRWFLNSALSGGGVLMDWGEYDMAILNTLFSTVAVTVHHGWVEQPMAATGLPDDVLHDVEHHVGASFSIRTEDAESIPVTYERTECTHGTERSLFEIEGTDGAVRWDWEPYAGDPAVTHTYDDNGAVRTETETFEDANSRGIHERPLVYFAHELAGESSPLRTNEDALFDFRCVRAIYETADSNAPTTVSESE